MKGYVHSVDSFSTLDGPGIRTVVFMQGCHLRCQYCHNPDTWNLQASTAQAYSAEEILAILQRSRPYFRKSGGGLTCSGGEPLLQYKFIELLFRKCCKEGFHTALDTSLYVKSEWVEAVLPWTNLFLADIKHINSAKSQEITGLGNELNLKNLQIINAYQTPIWIRYVIVPGITDDKDTLIEMSRFVSKLDLVERIELLPYHELGKHKWRLLNLKYPLENITVPSARELINLKKIVEANCNKPVIIPE